MRRDDKLDIRKAKITAKIRYAERQLQKWIKWSVDVKGGIKYKQLKQKQDEFKIECSAWRRE